MLGSDGLTIDRRTTLQGLIGALGTGLVGSGSASGQPSPESRNSPALTADQRWDEHLALGSELRETVEQRLITDLAGENSPNQSNTDADLVVRSPRDGGSYRPFAYSKALGYDSKLGIETGRHADFIEALVDGDTEYPLGDDEGVGDRPLISPLAMNAHATDSTDPWLGAIPPAHPAYDDGDGTEYLSTYLELLELYSAPYYRHNPLPALNDDPIPGLGAALQQDGLSIFKQLGGDGPDAFIFEWVKGPTLPSLAFRDPVYGCQVGPYVSQHLAHEIPLDGTITAAPTVNPIVSDPYGTTFEELEEISAGTTPGAEAGHDEYAVSDDEFGPEFADAARYIHTGQDLATYVRGDPSYTPFVNAARQLSAWDAPLADELPYDDTDLLSTVGSGAPAIETLLARVAQNALLAAYHQKWRVHRRPRPESYIERVLTAREGDQSNGPPQSAPPLSNFLAFWTESNALDLIEADGFGDGLQPQAYPEGAPASPSYPSAHSVVAGACATVLKTFFDNASYDDLDVDPRVNTDGTESGFESTDAEIDVHGEINKLASNIGMGRIFAGVSYRTDHIYGMLLGEQIAVATLYDQFLSTIGDRSDDLDAVDPDGELTFTPLVDGDVTVEFARNGQVPYRTVAETDELPISPETFADLQQAALDRDGLRP